MCLLLSSFWRNEPIDRPIVARGLTSASAALLSKQSARATGGFEEIARPAD